MMVVSTLREACEGDVASKPDSQRGEHGAAEADVGQAPPLALTRLPQRVVDQERVVVAHVSCKSKDAHM